MPRTRFTIKGLDDLKRAFGELPKRAAKKVTSQALRAALKPVQAEVQSKLHDPIAKKAVKVRTWPKRKRDLIALEVRVGDQDMPEGDFAAVRHQEYGSAETPASPVFRPAFDSNVSGMKATAAQLIGQGIEREAKALGK